MKNIHIEHKPEIGKGRFVIYVGDREAGYIKYDWMVNGNFNSDGTLVYPEFRELKLGKLLYDQLIAFAREKGAKIYPTCPYVVRLMSRDESVQDLYDEDYLKKMALDAKYIKCSTL